MSDMEKIRVFELVIKSLENQISEEEFAELDTFVGASKENAHYFTTCISTYMGVIDCQEATAGTGCFDEVWFDKDIWREMSEYERTAPTIELPKEGSQQELIQKVVYPPRQKQKISKFSIFTSALSAAAILFFVLFIKFAPPKQHSVKVATLVDQVNVKWADSRPGLENGSSLWTKDLPFVLDKGVISILYDNDVDVVIEAPAKFELEKSGILLEYGRLFSRVSESGLGFRIETPTCQFVDLGTEFGIRADINGSSELHVIKGEVQLFAPDEKNSKSRQTVQEDNAIRYDATDGQVTEIPIQKTVFARQVHSEANFIWRGQNTVCLADILGGGDGFGTGKIGAGIVLPHGYSTDEIYTDFQSLPGYNPVVWSALIDGVFVPDGEIVNVVSSLGHKFSGFCDTSGTVIFPILNGTPPQRQDVEVDRFMSVGLKLDSSVYGTRENPAIMMHPNAGVTFDLDKIRETLPGIAITGFRSKCGISEAVIEYATKKDPKAHFWVLLDGKQVFGTQGDVPVGMANDIDVPIHENQRFLTLATTDGGDGVVSDWCLFAEPQLILE